MAQMIKNLPAMWDTCVRSLGWEDPLEIFFLCVLWEYLKIYSFIKLQVYNTVLLAMILGYINMLCIGVPELTHPKTMWGDIHVSSLDCDHFIKYKHVTVLTPWTVAPRLLCPWGFSRQEYWSGLPCSPPGNLPNPGIESRSPALQADSLPWKPPWKPKNTRVGILSHLHGIFLTQESN